MLTLPQHNPGIPSADLRGHGSADRMKEARAYLYATELQSNYIDKILAQMIQKCIIYFDGAQTQAVGILSSMQVARLVWLQYGSAKWPLTSTGMIGSSVLLSVVGTTQEGISICLTWTFALSMVFSQILNHPTYISFTDTSQETLLSFALHICIMVLAHGNLALCFPVIHVPLAGFRGSISHTRMWLSTWSEKNLATLLKVLGLWGKWHN